VNSKVYLVFINDHFLPYWKWLSRDLSRCLPSSFDHLSVKIDLNLFYSAERNQYHSTLLLAYLLKSLPEDAHKIVGLTHVDIFIPIFTFVFGEAQLNGPGALISTYRLRNEFYGLPPDDTVLYLRTHKEILHELGHTMGLIHCPDFECVMHSATYVEDIDLKHATFCETCRHTIGVTC
jgi:archaemetzincin